MTDTNNLPQEELGSRCADGGKCHHSCKKRCFRRECCQPFSDYAGQWEYNDTSRQAAPASTFAGYFYLDDGVWKQAGDPISFPTCTKLYTATPAVQEPLVQDAEQYGSKLNDAAWAAVDAWDEKLMGPMSGEVFNNIKGVVRAAIIKYLEKNTNV